MKSTLLLLIPASATKKWLGHISPDQKPIDINSYRNTKAEKIKKKKKARTQRRKSSSRVAKSTPQFGSVTPTPLPKSLLTLHFSVDPLSSSKPTRS